MGSYNPEYESHLLALGEKMFLPQVPLMPRRRLRHRPDLELSVHAKSAPPCDSHPQKILAWLKSLQPCERISVCREENPWLSSVLRQMMVVKTNAGEGFFSLAPSRRLDGEELDDFFCFRKVSMEHGLVLRLADVLKSQREVEADLRFCDGKMNLDTVTLKPEFIRDLDSFLSEMRKVSNGKSFQTPCRTKWDAGNKLWLWELPPWAQSNQALSVWALACIERRVWMKYWELNDIDPRVAGETQPFVWEGKGSEVAEERNLVLDFWVSLGPKQQEDILKDLNSLYSQAKSQWERDPKPRKYSFPTPSYLSFSHSKHCSNFNGSLAGVFSCPAGTYYSAVKARMQCYQNSKSVEEIEEAFRSLSRKDFIEFLMYSDVVRAGSICDKVARAVVQRVKKALEEKYAEDLILSEAIKPTKANGRKPQKSPKKKAKSPTEAAVPASPASKPVVASATKEDVSPWIRGIVMGVVETLCVELLTDDDSFQLVQTSRRKPKPAPRASTKKKKHSTKSHHATAPTKPSPAVPPPLAIKVVYNAGQQKSIASEIVAAEFPPLAKPSAALPYPRLTEELLAFEQKNTSIVEQQTYTRMRVLSKLREVVSVVFPGAEADLFGSYSTGLALPTSDMDVAVRNIAFHFREELQVAVKSLNNYLAFQPWTVETQPIVTATVPLVKLQVDPSFFSSSELRPIKVDITFESPRSAAEHIGLASSDFVRRWLKANPQGKSVALTLKQMLAANDLNSAYFGGISSYALIIWIIAYLRTTPVSDSGALLLGVLQYYGSDFNPKTTGIDLLKSE